METDKKFNDLKRVVESSEANLILSKKEISELEK